MCIVISKPSKKTLSKSIYEESFRVNKDGAGFAYIMNHDIKVEKGFFDFDKFYSAIKQVEHLPLLIHCRITSHGPTNYANCHPFVFKPKDSQFQWVMAHNGVLAWRSTNKQSDTSCFCDDFLWPMLGQYPDFLDDGNRVLMLQRMINDRNKMVIIRYEKDSNLYTEYIINPSAGNRAHGCWFSNESWRPWRGYMGNGMHHGAFTDYDDYRADKSTPHSSDFPRTEIKNTRIIPIARPDNNSALSGTYGWIKNEYKVWINPSRLQAVITKNGLSKYETYGLEALQHLKPEGWKPGDPVVAEQLKLDGVKEDEKEEDSGDTLKHLDKTQRLHLHRFASDYMKASGIDRKGWSKMEKINWLRSDMRETYPAWKVLTDEALDKAMLTEDHDVIITVAEQKATDKKDQEAVDLARAQKN